MDLYSEGFYKVLLGNETDYTLIFHYREEFSFLLLFLILKLWSPKGVLTLSLQTDVALQALFSYWILTNSNHIALFSWYSKEKIRENLRYVNYSRRHNIFFGPIFACNHVAFKAVASFIAEVLGKHIPVSFYYS